MTPTLGALPPRALLPVARLAAEAHRDADTLRRAIEAGALRGLVEVQGKRRRYFSTPAAVVEWLASLAVLDTLTGREEREGLGEDAHPRDHRACVRDGRRPEEGAGGLAGEVVGGEHGGQTREAVLEALASRPFVTPAQLARELGLDPRANAAGRLLKELVAEGLAECAARGVYVAKREA